MYFDVKALIHFWIPEVSPASVFAPSVEMAHGI